MDTDTFPGHYPVSKQIAAWLYLDSKAVHPNILINTRPLYPQEVEISFELKGVRN